MIQQVFISDIADSILRTLLLNQVVDEKLIWKAKKNDLNSIKSAYILCMEELVVTSHLRRYG